MSAPSSLHPWKRRRRALRGWSLVVLALTALTLAPRVLIPQGFMPSGVGLSLVVCPDGLTPSVAAIFAGDEAHAAPHAHLAQHVHHDHAPPTGEQVAPAGHDGPGRSTHADAALSSQHCAFAAAAFVGPISKVDIALDDVAPIPVLPDRALGAPIPTLAHRPQQARAPPQYS